MISSPTLSPDYIPPSSTAEPALAHRFTFLTHDSGLGASSGGQQLQNFAGPLSRTAGRYAEHDRSIPLSGDVADLVLRAVPVPAGEHTVELRYESWSLRIGLAISLIFYVALIALVVAGTRSRVKIRGELTV